MFYSFDLVFESNKIIGRFENIGFSIITKIMDESKDPKIRIMYARLLHEFDKTIKYLDFFKDELNQNKAISSEIETTIEEKILNRLYSTMNIIMFDTNHNFSQQYEQLYLDKIQFFIKELWTAMPEDKQIPRSLKGFKDIFEDFHDQVVNKYPELFVKQLSDLQSMYRCRSWSINNDYELMVPNELYVKDNRWNPDGVAYLYVACGDANESYDGIVNMVQKTCFEEIRLKDEDEVAICEFKPIMKNAKIIDLCYEGVDLPKLSRELKVPPDEFTQNILTAINDSPNLTRIMKGFVQGNTKDGFIKKSKPYMKMLIKDTGLNEKIEELVYSKASTILLGIIDQSIFEAIDKIDDPELKTYLPFRAFSQFLIEKGYDGIIYRSTRMNKIGLSGKNLVLFDKMYATYEEGTMKKYRYFSGRYTEIS